jgi:Ca-activated chloride channel family protein
VQDLLQKLEGDRIGLIAFSGTAFVQCPLTVDYEAFRLTLKDARPGIIPRGGTAIGLAVRTALKAFEAGEGRDHAIILITDGEETESDALAAAEEASKQGARIYSIGVGSVEGELIPLREDGKLDFLKDKEGKAVKSRLNEATLRELALKTGGICVRSAAGDFGLDTIYEKGILQLRREEYEARLQKKFFERFQWPLGVAVVLLVIEMFLTDRRRIETARRSVKRETRNGTLATATTAAVLFCLVAGVRADPGGRLYDAGKYAEAFEWYQKKAEKEQDNLPLFYNLGAAAYKAGRPDEAAKAFERVTGSADTNLQAKALYNLGNSHFRIGEAAEQQSPQQAMPIYERAVKNYEHALLLTPNDAHARHNLEVVKRKIEELKKQQEQQQQQQDQQNQDEKKDENKDQKQQDQQNQPGQQQDQQQQQKPEDKQKQEQQSPQQQAQGQKDGKDQQPTGTETNNFEAVQARMLLDALREDEQNWNFFPELQMKSADTGEPEKDW